MEGIFTEFENENAIRSYPFAAGCVPSSDAQMIIPSGVFVDAALYPVNPSGKLYLSSVSEDGLFSISDDNGVIMTGRRSGSRVDFTDNSGLARHVGTLIASSEEKLDEFAGRGNLREYRLENTEFASSCVFPVVVDGVESVSVGGSDVIAGMAAFSNASDDVVRVSSGKTEDGRDTLRFDVVARIVATAESIRRIICVVDGKTPFRISKMFDYAVNGKEGYNTVILTLEGIDKGTICTAAHRENDYEMADTCKCVQPEVKPQNVPETYQIIETFIPPDPSRTEGGIPEGADNAFYLVVPNLVGYDNPLSITLEDGEVLPQLSDPEVDLNGNTAAISSGEFTDDISSKGIVIQVPGLSGGAA